MRIYATDGLVENNQFRNLAHHGLMIGMELSWPEVYHARNITIRNNTFAGISNLANIWLKSRLGNYSEAQGMGNQDITIEGNTFTSYGARTERGVPGAALGAITVTNARNVRIRNNNFGGSDATLTPPPEAIRLDLCAEVTVENNTIARRDRATEPIVLTARADKASVTLRGNKITP